MKVKRKYINKNNLVVFSKGKKITQDQIYAIKKYFKGELDYMTVDLEDMSPSDIYSVAFELCDKANTNVILLETNPLLVSFVSVTHTIDRMVTKHDNEAASTPNNDIFIFHTSKNKKGEKKGKIISIVDDIEYKIVRL